MKKTKSKSLMRVREYSNLERGITLVALIITIIVMLILVGVTVSVVIDSDIIGQAEQAGDAYQAAYEEESIGNIKINGEEYGSIDDYFNITFTIDGTEYIAKRGMTWEEWIESDYSKGDFEIFSEDTRFVSYTGTDEIVMYDSIGGWIASQSVAINEEITEYAYSSFGYRMSPIV